MSYALLSLDGSTEYTIPQPIAATWETVPVGTFADGAARVSRYKRVRWSFGPMTAAEYQALIQYRPANGLLRLRTWKRPTGGVAGQFVVCQGILPETVPGRLEDGQYLGVSLEITRVEEV